MPGLTRIHAPVQVRREHAVDVPVEDILVAEGPVLVPASELLEEQPVRRPQVADVAQAVEEDRLTQPGVRTIAELVERHVHAPRVGRKRRRRAIGQQEQVERVLIGETVEKEGEPRAEGPEVRKDQQRGGVNHDASSCKAGTVPW